MDSSICLVVVAQAIDSLLPSYCVMDKPPTSQSVSGASLRLGSTENASIDISNTLEISQTHLQSNEGPIIVIGDSADVEVSV